MHREFGLSMVSVASESDYGLEMDEGMPPPLGNRSGRSRTDRPGTCTSRLSGASSNKTSFSSRATIAHLVELGHGMDKLQQRFPYLTLFAAAIVVVGFVFCTCAYTFYSASSYFACHGFWSMPPDQRDLHPHAKLLRDGGLQGFRWASGWFALESHCIESHGGLVYAMFMAVPFVYLCFA